MRFFYIFAFIASFNFTGNAIAFMIAGVERRFKNWKRSYILDKFPECISPQSALDTLWEPKSLSVPSTENAATKFMEVDRQLKRGVTRTLLATALHMPLEDRLEFLNDSGYENLSEQLKSSMSMKKYLEFLEVRAKKTKNEKIFIDELVVEMHKIS